MKYIFVILFLVPSSAFSQSHLIDDIIPMEYWGGYHTSDNHLWALNFGNGIVDLTASFPGGRLVKKAGGGFNSFFVVCTDGTLWESSAYNTTLSWTQIPTDSSNATISNALWINAYEVNFVIVRSDSSLWFGGDDAPGIFHSSGTIYMRPLQMTTTLVKFRKAIICSRGVYAISSDSLSLYYWGPGAGQTPTTIYTFGGSGTGKIIDVGASNGNAFTSATFAIIQQTSGSPYGRPEALGQGYGFWGSGTPQNFTSFTDLYSQWGLTSLVKEITVNFQTTVFVDSAGKMGACGWNVQGEVGNGQEFVNRYTYVNWPNYGWDGAGGENVVTGVQWIGTGVNFQHVSSNLFFTYWHGALDVNDSVYTWGRDKTQVQPFPIALNTTDNAAQPNWFDVLVPTMGHPFAINSTKTLNWTSPTIGISGTTAVRSISDTLTVTGHPALAINASNITDTVEYTPATYTWSKVSGPAGDHIVSPNSKSTVITGLSTGTYVYQILTVDNNQGMNLATVTLNAVVNIFLRHRGSQLAH